MRNLIQTDGTRCTVALKGHLIFQPCTRPNTRADTLALEDDAMAEDCRRSAGPNGLVAALHTAQR